jgi:hypothetical protein
VFLEYMADFNMFVIVAKAALRRKKQFEHSLEQTSSQIMTLEREIYSIETANINKETLDAMKNAGKAMQQIHQGLTIDKVDQTMYVISIPVYFILSPLQAPFQGTNRAFPSSFRKIWGCLGVFGNGHL